MAKTAVATGTEQTLYSDTGVLVSTTRLIVNGVTYPLANVSSVRLMTQPPNRTFAVILIIVGLIAFAFGQSGIVFGLLCLGLGVLLCFVQKSTYVMLIGSAGGEKSALSSTNASYMTSVVEHINRAIIERG